MTYISAETATKDSVEAAIDAAFDIAGVKPGWKSGAQAIYDTIRHEFEASAKGFGLTYEALVNGRSRINSASRRVVICRVYDKGYSAGEIAKAIGRNLGTVNYAIWEGDRK